MNHIEKSIEVGAPVRSVYNQWTQFEDFPSFMEGVKAVRQINDNTLHWRAQVGGKEVEWTAEIVEQVPDTKIAWRTNRGAENAGTVYFASLGPSKTKVTLQVFYEPEGFVENVGSVIGVLSARVEGDLKRFKNFIELRGQETGSWRGEIHRGKVTEKDSEAGEELGA